jgi:hypothetical protein
MIILGLEIQRARFRRRRLTLRRLLALFAAAGLVTAVGAAYAAWTSNGSGSATAKAGTVSALTTSVATVTTGLLYPGGPTGDVKITINNPNPFPVRVTQINGNGAITAAGGTGACTTTGVTFTNQTGTFDVGASLSGTFTLTGAASMSSASQDGCQNAVFTIPVTLIGTSN